jgi:predicted nucleotidyltransferase
MDQLTKVVALTSEVLRGGLLGVYLHGSAVFGGLMPRSDLDVLAVTNRLTTPEERRALIERLLPISGRGDPSGQSRSVELTMVVGADVRPWRYPPRLEFMYGDWWRADFEAGNLAPWASPNPDLAITLSQVLAADRPLFGPPPGELLDPVPNADLRRAMVDGIPSLLADLRGDEANVILTLARIGVTLETGVIVPKDVAADRMAPGLGSDLRPVVERARAIYLGEADDRWDDLASEIKPAVAQLLGEIQRARAV